jgi:Family of unknown function (DUF6328)
MEEEGAAGREETEHQRLDRNFNELLQELRVSQTGVQILFAFLLTLPFTQRFDEVSSFQKDVYFITLLLAGCASILFIGPVSWHRVLFRRSEKREVVFAANWMAIGGLVCLSLALVGVILFVTDFLFSATAAVIAAGCVGLMIVVLWYTLPLIRLIRIVRRDRGD